LWRPERHGACLLPWSLLFYFCQLLPRVILLVFPLVSAAIDDENYFKFKWLWHKAVAGQGHQRIIFLVMIFVSATLCEQNSDHDAR
jgi:hypothetical protein